MSKRDNDINKDQNQGNLRHLLEQVSCLLHEEPANLDSIKESLVCLLSFICEPKNRTHNNCKAVDLFFCLDNLSDVSWNSLPEDYRQLFDDIGGCMHDTVESPEIATNFDSTTEQLLSRAKGLNK